MLRRTVYLSRVVFCLRATNSVRGLRAFSNSYIRSSDPFPSVLENVVSPLEVTSVLRSGKDFKLRTLQDPEPRTVHGNLIVLDGEHFLWRPQLYSPQPGVLDIAPESWGILDVISPKPGTSEQPKRLRQLEIVILGTGDKIMLEALTDNDIVFNTLFDVSDKYFEKWGVSLGIQMLLKSHKLKFEKARLKGHIQDI
jgi:hypothetical protein